LVRVSIFPIVGEPAILLQLFCRQSYAFFVPKKPIFTPSQIDRMANILDNAGQGFFVVLLPLFLPRLVQNGQSKEAQN